MGSITDPLALRTTSSWTSYGGVAAIPWIYGRRVRVNPIQYSADKREHVIAGHPIPAVLSVVKTEDGSEIGTYGLVNTKDSAGEPIALIRFNESIDEDDFYVVVQGKTDADGDLIVNPADIVFDVISGLGTVTVAREALDILRDQTAGLELSVIARDQDQSLHSLISDLMRSIYAAWSISAPSFAYLLQTSKPVAEPYAAYLSPLDLLAISTQLDFNVVTDLKVLYAADEVTGSYNSVTLTARAAQSHYQLDEPKTQEIILPYLAREIDALSVGRRMLQNMSRIPIQLNASVHRPDQANIDPITWIRVSDSRNAPDASDYFVTNVRAARQEGSAEIIGQAYVGNLFSIELVRSGTTFGILRQQAFVTYQDGIATFTIVDESGAAVKNATVTIDGETKLTDANGQAFFTLEPGLYVITIQRDDFLPETIERNIG